MNFIYLIISSGKTIKTAVNLPRRGHPSMFTPAMFRETAKKKQELHLRLRRPHLSCWVLKFTIVQLEKRVNKYGLFGRGTSILSKKKKNMAAHFKFVKLHLNKPQDFCSPMFIWQMRPKLRCLVMIHSTKLAVKTVFSENETVYQTPHTNCEAPWWRADYLALFCSHRTWTSCSPSWTSL